MFNKRVLKKATDDLDKVKKPAKSKDIIVDPRGQWAFPGEVTRIPSNTITMEGVDYPVLGIPNYGEPKIMMPGQYYEFPEADYVDEYPEFAEGGSAGCPKGFYYNGKECVKLPKGAKVITDPKEYAYRKAMYEDSASLYNAYQFQKKNLDPTVTLTDFVKSYNNATKLLYDGKRPKMTVDQIKKIRNTNFNKNIPRLTKNDYKEVKANPRGDYDPMNKNTGDYKVYDYYKKLKFNHPVAIGQYSSPDVYHSKILPTRNYFDGVAYSPVYAKPKQPVVFGNEPSEEIIKIPLPPNTIQVGEKEVLNLDEKTGIVTRIIEPIYEKIPENKTPEPPVKKEDIIVKQAVPTSSQITESQYIEEGVPDTTVGMEWVNKPERYIDWKGTSIGYRLPRFRKPGHGGDLIKKGKQRYIHLPTIETRNTAELVPEEEYRRGGIIPKYLKMPKNYGRSKYSSNISATNKVFARNILFRKERNKIYDPNAKYQDGGEYVELDLTPEEIQEYAKGGYIVEDISVPSLTKAQRGLFKKKDKQDPNKLEYREPVKVEDDLVESVTPFPEAPEDFKKGVANLKEVEAGPYWLGISREYSGKHNKQAFIDKKKRQYLKQGLAKAAGLSMENFPKNVEKNFINEYNYNRNNYVVKKLFKNAGVSPNKREDWIDTINSDDNADVRALIKNSKYGNKLKPSIWARTLAGLGTMASKFSPEIADAMERGDLPGLSREEQRAIKNAKIKGIPVGGIEALAGADAVGVALANAVEASGNESYGGDYKKAPGLLSGDVMPKITDDQIAVLNPSTYTVGYDFAPVGKGLLKGATKIGKASVSAGKAGIKAGKKFGKSISEIDLKPAMGKLQAHFDRPPGPLMLGLSKGTVFDKEIKNPDYFTDLMKINKYSPKQKKYYEGLVNSVKKQGNMASQKQYDELQRLKTGDTNYGKKGYAKGGIVSDLSRKEIDKLVAQGYIVETVD